MWSDTLGRVQALGDKAEELCNKGYILRAAENFGRAADAARALGEDNLVGVRMQLRRSNMLSGYAGAPSVANTVDPRVLAAHRGECIALVSSALAALERRRVADTLLEGKCAAVEEAWYANTFQQHAHNLPAAMLARTVTLVGYEEFFAEPFTP